MSMSVRQRGNSKEADDEKTEARSSSSSSSSSTLSGRALASTANLANLLPTGTLLAFQILTPVFSNNGSCDSVTRCLTLGLLILLSFSCFLASFTDSVKASDGQVYHGVATVKGLWLFEEPPTSSVLPDLRKYRMRVMDWVHALLSVLVFYAVALRDNNVLNCFYPKPEHETKEVLDILPLGIGLICSLLFLVFPTTRHGIGFPVTPGK
ncbi:hypothetical protein RJT34_13255 [Clitoria ternatea]|uniref:Uncharacterized protein n=1 Tax=Clitoria ternatea TaxID=43366 RepID=A0AAN9JNL5_CLITE